MDNLFSEFDRACDLLEYAYGECSGCSQEDLSKTDVLLDYFMGTLSTVFHRVTALLSGHKIAPLEDYVRNHERAVKDVISATDIPYGTLILPCPQGMVWGYPKTITEITKLYNENPPAETVRFLKTFSQNLAHRDRVALATTLAMIERETVKSTIEQGLLDLFVDHALGHKTGQTLFGGQSGFKTAYTDMMALNTFYGESVQAAKEITRLEETLKRTIVMIVNGSGIDKDSAAIAAKTLRLLGGRLRAMSSLLVKMDAVEQNFVRCLDALVRYRARNKT